ncbi:hypothetical protein [Kitasatospora aureofaciens]|uniref:hypothetical protein n=1 Tax=Kitasatospora aureofaciens TaxID=1894 RepID=UPI003813EF34
MSTTNCSAPAVSSLRHRTPDRDRIVTVLTACWPALHIPVALLLGLIVHESELSQHSPTTAATTPDLPVVWARRLFTRSSERRTVMHNITEVPTMSTELARVDYRTTPEYYFDTEHVTDRVVLHLLSCCPTVFGLKKAVTDLLAGRHDCPLPASEGVIEPGATVRGEVIVAAGAVIAEGAFVTGPTLICPGTVVEAGARVRDNTVIGPGCRIGFGAEITRSLLLPCTDTVPSRRWPPVIRTDRSSVAGCPNPRHLHHPQPQRGAGSHGHCLGARGRRDRNQLGGRDRPPRHWHRPHRRRRLSGPA